MDLKTFVNEGHRLLVSGSDESKVALDYLIQERGLSRLAIEENLIGFCGESSEVPDTNGDRKMNLSLRGKIIVPITSEFGNLVGVAGRYPSKDCKGWWNSRFKKEHHLFLFNSARKFIFESNKAYLFEGYFDALILRQYQLMNCTAIMGTSLGYRRIALLARYCDRVCLVFDNDPNDAGLMAQLKTMADLWSLGFGSVSRINLPLGIDADDFVRVNGLKAFLDLEENASESDLRDARRKYEALRAEKHLVESNKRLGEKNVTR